MHMKCLIIKFIMGTITETAPFRADTCGWTMEFRVSITVVLFAVCYCVLCLV